MLSHGNEGFNLKNKVVFYLGGNEKMQPFNFVNRTFDPYLTLVISILPRFTR